MPKTVLISNRLPIKITRDADTFAFSPSIGGLATGLKSMHDEGDSLWIGWCGLSQGTLTGDDHEVLEQRLKNEHQCVPVFLSDKEMDDYYYGFCNHTIWPLFHYFTGDAEYRHTQWDAYHAVNRKFYDRIADIVDNGDTVWVHDYHLMLLPQMIRKTFPDTRIGFFLHIPFPSFEIFRLLPWREQILKGLLGADLVGFHTYDYVRHFFSSVRRLLGYEQNLGYLNIDNRLVKSDVFPMGIDYDRYHNAHKQESVQEETRDILSKAEGTRLILSVDRLDYTKGIPERIKSFRRFLQAYPEYRENVTLILIVAPSRTEVDTYHDLLKEVQELVSDTNGEHGTIGWVPIWFFFRSFGFESLTALFAAADVLLVTPVRDGMNLVAKEYVAAHPGKNGMLVLSETAGVVSELGEAIIVNPNNIHEVADGIKAAFEMSDAEKISKTTLMQKRLSYYNVEYWAHDFLDELVAVKAHQEQSAVMRMNAETVDTMLKEAQAAEKRLFLLDYDGTLTGFTNTPAEARPDAQLKTMLRTLAEDPRNHVLIISGRDRHCLTEWFGDLPVSLTAAHGMWTRHQGAAWEQVENLNNEWKETIRPMLDVHTARTPGSFLEEKDYSLAWHYRRCELELAAVRVSELKDALSDLTQNLNIGLLTGNKVIEIKDTTVNKGRAASLWLHADAWDFIFAAGDDWTDEDMFAILPDNAWSIKVGSGISEAHYRTDSTKSLRTLLSRFTTPAYPIDAK